MQIDNSIVDVYHIALKTDNTSLWSKFFDQIYVVKNNNYELIPRIGRFRIILGDISNIDSKLTNLRYFYLQGLPYVGWDKYKIINLSVSNQIICTK